MKLINIIKSNDTLQKKSFGLHVTQSIPSVITDKDTREENIFFPPKNSTQNANHIKQ